MENSSKTNNLTLDVNEKPSIWQWIILAFQHVFAMFGATILVPILVNSAVSDTVLTIPVTLVAAGLGTLLYILCTKGKSPVFLGSSFAFITPIIIGYTKGGIGGAMTGIMLVGIIYMIISVIIHFTGKGWLDKLLPPIVIGPMIMIIGLGLSSSAVNQIGINISNQAINWKGVLVALVTFLTAVIIMVKAKGFFKVIPFLIGILAGYLAAVALNLIDFSSVQSASFFKLPDFKIPFKDYNLDFLVSLSIAPIALVTIAEHIGDHKALSHIIGKDLLKEPGLDKTLFGDGLATFVAGLIGGPANTTYGENTSVVGMTKVASVWVIGLAAIFSIILGFLGKFTAAISTIPAPVLGGISLLLYGFIAVNGLKILIENKIDFRINKNIIIASTMLVLGLGGAAITIATKNTSLTFSGMSLAGIIGVILNIVLPDEPLENDDTKTITCEKTNKGIKINGKNYPNIIELHNSILEHKLGILRNEKTGTKEFREIVSELSEFLCYKAMENIELDTVEIKTPLVKVKAKQLNEDNFAFIPILRAGTGMLNGVINVIPNAKIGHIGMYRDEKNNNKPVNYFFKVPKGIEKKEVIILDPMLATGGSILDSIELLKKKGVKKIKVLCIIAAPEGLELVCTKHPEVEIYCINVDEKLNDIAYIVPGLGDAGDRIFGTK